jgi:NADH-quinone oxidoreductase subunit L
VLAALSVFIFYSVNPFDGASGWIAYAVERPESAVPVRLAAPSAGAFEEVLARVNLTAMLLSLSVAGLGILAAFATYYWKKISADAFARALAPVHTFLVNKWYFDELYQAVVVKGVLGLASVLRWVDTFVVDGAVNGAGRVTRGVAFVSGKFDTYVVDGLVNFSAYLSGFFGLVLRKFQTGKVQTYVLYAVLGVMVFYFIFRLV